MWLQLLAAIASLHVILVIWLGGFRDFYYRIGWYESKDGSSFSCGELNISYPFTCQGSKSPGFPLICHHNTTLLVNLTLYHRFSYAYMSTTLIKQSLPLFQGIYHVTKIDTSSYDSMIQIVDPNFASTNSSSTSCLLPRYPMGAFIVDTLSSTANDFVTWVKCRKAMKGDEHLDPATYLPLPCPAGNNDSFSYLLLNSSTTAAQLDLSCQTVATTAITRNYHDGLNLTRIWSRLQMGFTLSLYDLLDFYCSDAAECRRYVYHVSNKFDLLQYLEEQLAWFLPFGIVVLCIVPRILSIFFLATLLIFKYKKKYSSSNNNMEKLLQKCQHLMPRRYSYPEIKIITTHFREKLGQGGFGSVFKGSLFDSRPVAVKLLGKGKSCGQDFINEIATIGRIHHVNIVRLLGFCSEGSTRALVYEFMSKGSLDKYIFPGIGRSHLLGWEMLHKIALGIARGLEYLHRGCDMCILHFDIKPHNVLLDENFCPKISDFGIAKLSPTQHTITFSGYIGTIGYIAPEQVSRNLGRVSYKSDVYSFGMLLLQMAGRAKKREMLETGCNQIDLPAWIYDRLSQGRDVETGEATDIEVEIVNKLALVGLYCVQMMPANRPSMSQVIEMLEGSSDALQLPPKSFFLFADAMSNKECSSMQSKCSTITESASFAESNSKQV